MATVLALMLRENCAGYVSQLLETSQFHPVNLNVPDSPMLGSQSFEICWLELEKL